MGAGQSTVEQPAVPENIAAPTTEMLTDPLSSGLAGATADASK